MHRTQKSPFRGLIGWALNPTTWGQSLMSAMMLVILVGVVLDPSTGVVSTIQRGYGEFVLRYRAESLGSKLFVVFHATADEDFKSQTRSQLKADYKIVSERFGRQTTELGGVAQLRKGQTGDTGSPLRTKEHGRTKPLQSIDAASADEGGSHLPSPFDQDGGDVAVSQGGEDSVDGGSAIG